VRSNPAGRCGRTGSRRGGKSIEMGGKIGEERRTRNPGDPVGNPVLRPSGKGLGQVPGRYPTGNIPTPQISPLQRLPIGSAGWIWYPTGSRSSSLWGGGHHCAKGFSPRASWQNPPFATRTSADRTRILTASRTHTPRMESLAYAQNWRIICPGRLKCQPLIGAVRLFGVVSGWPTGGTEVQTEQRQRG
jgi:hypothetical protein